MTTLKEIQDYNADLCKRHKELLHTIEGRVAFARFKTDEQINQIKNKATSNIVVVAAVNGLRVGALDDRSLRRGISFIFASRAVTSGSRAVAIENANDKAEEIMFDFVNQWEMDLQNDCEIMQAFDLEKISWDEIDSPWLDNYYGWILFVPYKTDMPPYNPDKWNDE